MPLSRPVLERQLKLAEQTLAQRVQVLEKSGKSAEACDRDPQWRSANANCGALRRRLKAVAAVEANNAEVTRRKLEPKVEEAPAEKPAPKAKEKKKAEQAEGAAPKAEKQKSDKPKGEKAKKEK